MIKTENLRPILEEYKNEFLENWDNEKFKWEAVKHFQENWDINAENFGEMFEKATSNTNGILDSGSSTPRARILDFAKADDEATRKMFQDLYDESKDLESRIKSFSTASEEMRNKYNNGTWKRHFQNPKVITTYLWLRFPDKNYIYDSSIYNKVGEKLSDDYNVQINNYNKNIKKGYQLYDEIRQELISDQSLCSLVNETLTSSGYSDSEMITTMIDFGHYFFQNFCKKQQSKKEKNNSLYKYDLFNMTTEEWVNLLKDSSVFTLDSLRIMAQIKDFEDLFTIQGLSREYGESIDYYKRNLDSLVNRVEEKTDLSLHSSSEDNFKWETIFYLYNSSDINDIDNEDSYFLELRGELKEALEIIDFNELFLSSEAEITLKEQDDQKYWWVNANPKYWSFSKLKVGEERYYTFYNENGNKRHIFQNFIDAKVGDIVIGYDASPYKKIVAICLVSRKDEGKAIYFKKIEDLNHPIDYSALKDSHELENMICKNGSLFKLSRSQYDFIMDLIRKNNPQKSLNEIIPKYSDKDFLNEVFISEERLKDLKALLHNKKNIILQGAPGVGKTFMAKRLAYTTMGELDDSRIELIQFHQNYSYEDFIMGYHPSGSDFKLTEGIFFRFCQKAEENPDRDYFFIIDEINRGNLSKIFGELLMLIEKDYRGVEATLPYTGKPFSVPENLYIIGMMNTADRSLALIDYALRRRFSFCKIEPGFNSDGFINYQNGLSSSLFNALIKRIEELNKDIREDKSLGNGFQIGHSYFCNLNKEECTRDRIHSIVEFDILPILEEYWFDEPEKVDHWKRNLWSLFND